MSLEYKMELMNGNVPVRQYPIIVNEPENMILLLTIKKKIRV